MGILESRVSNKQILILGLDDAGKTTLFNLMTGKTKKNMETLPTISYNIENDSKYKNFTIWDIGGKASLRVLWSSIYKNIAVNSIIFVVDISNEDRILEAKMELKKLMNEEELRSTFLIMLFNDKFQGDESKTLSREEEKKMQQIFEEKMGVNQLHPSVIKTSFLINLSLKAHEQEYDLENVFKFILPLSPPLPPSHLLNLF